jgi:hypothetical protein
VKNINTAPHQDIFLAPLPGNQRRRSFHVNYIFPRQLRASSYFSSAVAGEKEDFCKGSFTCTSFTFF